MNKKVLATCVAAILISPLRAADEKKPVDTSKLPAPASKKVDFAADIKPIFDKSCVDCHGPEKQKAKYRLDSREAALKGGKSKEAAIVPGHSDQSPLIHYVARLVEDMEMPPEGKKPPLTKEQLSVLRAWIDQGAKWD